jgi:hypothetical protein
MLATININSSYPGEIVEQASQFCIVKINISAGKFARYVFDQQKQFGCIIALSKKTATFIHPWHDEEVFDELIMTGRWFANVRTPAGILSLLPATGIQALLRSGELLVAGKIGQCFGSVNPLITAATACSKRKDPCIQSMGSSTQYTTHTHIYKRNVGTRGISRREVKSLHAKGSAPYTRFVT